MVGIAASVFDGVNPTTAEIVMKAATISFFILIKDCCPFLPRCQVQRERH